MNNIYFKLFLILTNGSLKKILDYVTKPGWNTWLKNGKMLIPILKYWMALSLINWV